MAQEEFIKSIINNLESNGFPKKRVSLPLEKMYEIADSKGLNFNAVLKSLSDEHGINHESQVEKIIFFPKPKEVSSLFGGVDLDSLKNMDEASLMGKVQEMMSQMGPDQMAEIKKMYDGMSEDEKADIMKKGKSMGIVKD